MANPVSMPVPPPAGSVSEAAFDRPPESVSKIVWKRFRRHRLAVFGGIVLVFLLAASFSAPFVARHVVHHKFEDQDILNPHLPPSADHWFGTDDLGRDLFVRMLYGGQISMSVGLLAAVFSTIIGTVIGVVAGYYGRWVDSILMRLTDAMLSIPILPLMIIFSSVDLDKIGLGWLKHVKLGGEKDGFPVDSVVKILVVVILFEWMGVARLVRGSVLTLKERDFVTAARAAGAGPVRIMFVHLIPNAIAPIVVSATLAIGSIILYESVLSFLGLGIQPPTPSWGNMLSHAKENMDRNLRLALLPGAFIWVTVTCFNFLGDGLRDAMDPKYVMEKK